MVFIFLLSFSFLLFLADFVYKNWSVEKRRKELLITTNPRDGHGFGGALLGVLV